MPRRELGGLNCHVIDSLPEGATPSLAVILCHGYGAPADDLAPLGAELLQTDPAIEKNVRFYFPAALLDLGPLGLPGGRAWWPLDMNRLVLAAQTGRWDELRSGLPAGLSTARERLTALVEAICTETGLPLSRVVLGGFSQGAMLSMDVALRLPGPVAALCLASGALVNEPEWTRLAGAQKPLRVLQSHGRQDPILPFFGAEALRDVLVRNGHKVEFIPFNGGHTIPWPVLHAFSRLLVELAS
jgi:phospholipase/carboxylesterase